MYFPIDDEIEYSIRTKDSIVMLEDNYEPNRKYVSSIRERIDDYHYGDGIFSSIGKNKLEPVTSSSSSIWDSILPLIGKVAEVGIPLITKGLDYRTQKKKEEEREEEKKKYKESLLAKDKQMEEDRNKKYENIKMDREMLLDLLSKTTDPKERLEILKLLK
jgi:hypothetical protein